MKLLRGASVDVFIAFTKSESCIARIHHKVGTMSMRYCVMQRNATSNIQGVHRKLMEDCGVGEGNPIVIS